MTRWISSLLLALLSGSAWAEEIPFTMSEDSLCFLNKDPRLADYGPLGRLGTEKGVCQGIAGISAAFFELGRFDPSLPKPTEAEARALVDRFVRLHSGNCSRREVVPGFANVKEFCAAFPGIFLKKSVDYNAGIAVREIAPHLPLFYGLKRNPIRTQKQRRLLDEAVQSLRKRVREGKSPLVLVYSHVMNVVSVTQPGSDVVVSYYDSNDLSGLRSLVVKYDADGLPALGENRMLWDITPERGGVDCDGSVHRVGE